MFKIFNPTILGAFYKQKRLANEHTIKDVSIITHYSTGTISALENSETIIEDEKIRILNNVYNIPNSYFSALYKHIPSIIENFLFQIIYIDDEKAQLYIEELNHAFSNYNNTIFFIAYKLCYVIYQMYLDIQPDGQDIKYLIDNYKYFSEPMQCICNIYIFRYYMREKKYQNALKYIDMASNFSDKNHMYYQMVNYNYVFYYLKINDIFNSLKFIEYSKADFTKFQNYKRLVNLNILSSLQYLNIKSYSKALEINFFNLKIIDQMNMIMEKRIVLYNISYIYILKNDFENALIYISKIPDPLLTEKHINSYVYILFKLNDFNAGNDMCNRGLKIAQNKFNKSYFKIFSSFFNNKDYKQLTNKLIKLYNIHADSFDFDTKEYYLLMISKLCEYNHQLKKANDYLKKLYTLRLN